MKTSNIQNQLDEINSLIDQHDYTMAESKANTLYIRIKDENLNEKIKAQALFNLAAFFTDIGEYSEKYELCKKGLEIFSNSAYNFDKLYTPDILDYNKANALGSILKTIKTHSLTFQNIDEFIRLKNLYWKAHNYCISHHISKPELKVNLANSLKRQFRISEALCHYDDVISLNIDIPQAHINRAETLKMLSEISDSYSIKMIYEIIHNYKIGASSHKVPPNWAIKYQSIASHLEELHGISYTNYSKDNEENHSEFTKLSNYRKFLVDNKLVLSEHSLYCFCKSSAQDDMSISTSTEGLVGEFIPQMEMALNRIKSEYSLARRLFYESQQQTAQTIDKDDCYTELLNGEILSMDIEKLRTTFRLCFGILDKIAHCICELYDVWLKENKVSFHNFFRLNHNDRRELFESIKNPGLLALYSIATDLNQHQNGELSFYKDLRNALEHSFLTIKDDQNECDPFKTYELSNNLIMINKNHFEEYVSLMLQITRSAIFSFVFSVRHKGQKKSIKTEATIVIGKKT